MWAVSEMESQLQLFPSMLKKPLIGSSGGICLKYWKFLDLEDHLLDGYNYYTISQRLQFKQMGALFFRLGRDTRQGSPLSPLLFCLALEPLAAAIRQGENFRRIDFAGSVHKLMLYVDDILLFVSDPQVSVPSLLNIINSFSKFSGYKVN